MKNKFKLIINNKFYKNEKFFFKKELQTILNLYAKKVSSGDWKDYGLSLSKKQITFDIYKGGSEKPIYRISKDLMPKNRSEKFFLLDKNGSVIKKSENLDTLVNTIDYGKLKLVR